MTTTQAKAIHHESTYQMLVEAEEKDRSAVEDFVYLLLILATAVTIWQFGRQPVTFANIGDAHADKIAMLLGA
jgi:hypothetical protein